MFLFSPQRLFNLPTSVSRAGRALARSWFALASMVTPAQPPSFTVSPCRGISWASLPPQHLLTFKAATHTDGLVVASNRNGECQAGKKGELLSALNPALRCLH